MSVIQVHDAMKVMNLSEDLCERALGALTRSGFLLRTPEGVYVRPNAMPPSIQSVTSLLRTM